MTETLTVRESTKADIPAIEDLYPRAFPDEDLLPIVRPLLVSEYLSLSLAGIMKGSVVGHIAFTSCSVKDHPEKLAMLAPLAVDPECQRQGVGKALIAAGLKRLEKSGICKVLVLGDPAYYSRSGFLPERKIIAPYDLTQEYQDAWQSLDIGRGDTGLRGLLQVPKLWQQESLWTP
ncbi:MAG: GNAT family N-acetyltransferase [Rhizobiaceae bacterium]